MSVPWYQRPNSFSQLRVQSLSVVRTSKLGLWSAERTVEAFYGVTRSASHRRGSDSGDGGVGTLASARALRPLYENVPYFGDRGGELRRSTAPTRDRDKTVRSKLRHRN